MAAAMQVVSPGDGTIKILKWKVKKDSMVMKGSILALYEAPNTKSQLKLKSTATIVDEILVQAGSESPPGFVFCFSFAFVQICLKYDSSALHMLRSFFIS